MGGKLTDFHGKEKSEVWQVPKEGIMGKAGIVFQPAEKEQRESVGKH